MRSFHVHKKKAFNVAWSPLIPNELASGSDDKLVVIYNTTTGESKVAVGTLPRSLLPSPRELHTFAQLT